MLFYSRLLFYIKFVLYELKYYFLGATAIIDDVVSKKTNICPPLDKEGCVAVVTGGARGIGLALVKKFLLCNMTVIVGCRNEEEGQRRLEKLRSEGITTGQTFVYPLDLMSFSAIKKFARLVSSNHPRIHILVNNAGIMFPPYNETADGFESQWGVNYIGPALLIHLLLPLLERGSTDKTMFPRIVNVSSCAHIAANSINFNDINMKKDYIPSSAYARSKLAQILLTIELDKRLKAAGSRVSVHSVHPGIVNTDLFDGTVLKNLMPWVLTYVCKNVDEGATSVFFPCVSPVLDGLGGTYSTNCRLIKPGKLTSSVALQKQMYEFTLQTLGINHFGDDSHF